MSKKKNAPDTEGKYKAMCQDYQEREELEKLNRQTRDRVSAMEKAMHDRLAKQLIAEAIERRRIDAIAKFMATVILTLTICVALAVLAWIEASVRPALIILCAAMLLIGTFRAGCSWNEIKR